MKRNFKHFIFVLDSSTIHFSRYNYLPASITVYTQFGKKVSIAHVVNLAAKKDPVINTTILLHYCFVSGAGQALQYETLPVYYT